jgi:hypothetical protein
MHIITIGNLTFKYIVGVYTVGIVTPSRKSCIRDIEEVSGRPRGGRTGIENGTADNRLTPEEVAGYCLKNKLL